MHTIYTIEVNTTTKIQTTSRHPFYVEGEGWVIANQLQVGMNLQTMNGTAVITNLQKERTEEVVPVYNFRVSEWSSYFVSEWNVYVHNANEIEYTSNNKKDKPKIEGDSDSKLPNQGTVKGDVENAPPVDAGKQGKHVQGHPNYKEGNSTWQQGNNGVHDTQEAWLNGTELPDGTKVWDTGNTVGTNGETGVRVHIDKKGNIHGYPVDPERYLPD